MYLQYLPLISKKIELFDLNDSQNVSKVISINPVFIMPDGTIYYDTNDHSKTKIIADINYANNVIKTNSLTKTDKENILNYKLNELLKDYERISKNNIINYDVEKYLNNYSQKKNYSSDMKKYLLMLIKSKIQIYEYFKQNIDNIIDYDIIDYMINNMNIDKIEKALPNTITTSKGNYLTYYYNYIIMDYYINKLLSNDIMDFHIESIADEIKLIKALPLAKRKDYLK